jgi:hypothetical protein
VIVVQGGVEAKAPLAFMSVNAPAVSKARDRYCLFVFMLFLLKVFKLKIKLHSVYLVLLNSPPF